MIESSDSTEDTLKTVFEKTYGKQNQGLPDNWTKEATLVVVTDLLKTQLAGLINIPSGRITDNKRTLRITDLFVYAVQNEELLKDFLKKSVQKPKGKTDTKTTVESKIQSIIQK